MDALSGLQRWQRTASLPRSGRTSRLGTRGVLLLVGIVAATLTAPRAAAPQPGREVIVRELAAGKVLVAARNLPDPNFADTVVLLVQYSGDGAAGLVINRPSDVPLSRALHGVEALAGVAATAFIGGPVSRQAVLALSRTACPACPRLGPDVYLVNTADALRERLAKGADERQLRVYLGYAGWGSGQLEAETRQGAWRVLDADARIVFDAHPETLWRRMIRRTEAVLASLREAPRRRAAYAAGVAS
jgi:putative transcriptional regulator